MMILQAILLLCACVAFVGASILQKHHCVDKIYAGYSDGSLLISDDAGHSWTGRDPLVKKAIYSISAVNEMVYVGTSSDLHISKNGGYTWRKQIFMSEYENIQSVFARGATVHAVDYSSGRYFMSNNRGDSWAVNTTVTASGGGNPDAVYSDGKKIYIGTTYGLIISDDNGKTWKVVNQGSYINANAIAGFNDNVYVGLKKNGSSIAITQDGGQTWGNQNTTRLEISSGANSIAVDANGRVYVGTEGAGLAMSNNVWKEWVSKRKVDGLPDDNIRAVTVSGNNIYVGGGDAVAVSHDGGETWQKIYLRGGGGSHVSALYAHCV